MHTQTHMQRKKRAHAGAHKNLYRFSCPTGDAAHKIAQRAYRAWCKKQFTPMPKQERTAIVNVLKQGLEKG